MFNLCFFCNSSERLGTGLVLLLASPPSGGGGIFLRSNGGTLAPSVIGGGGGASKKEKSMAFAVGGGGNGVPASMSSEEMTGTLIEPKKSGLAIWSNRSNNGITGISG